MGTNLTYGAFSGRRHSFTAGAKILAMSLIASSLVLFDPRLPDSAEASGTPIDFTHISRGTSHTIAIGTDGYLYSWGENEDGQLGNGSNTDRSTPGRVSRALTGSLTFSAIAAGSNHNLAVSWDGRLFSWGGNSAGQLGIGNQVGSNTPVEVALPPGASSASQVSAGNYSSFVLADDGKLFGWGIEQNVGDGTSNRRLTPVAVAPTLLFRAVAAGWHHAIALGTDDRIYGWGQEGNGAVGNGVTSGNGYVLSPVISVSTTTFSAIASGGLHSFALRHDGTLYSWGNNEYGQLGRGGTVKSGTPGLVVSSPVTFSSVVGGRYHSVALSSDGRIMSWGANTGPWNPALGTGTFTDRTTPGFASTQSSGAVTFSALASGGGGSDVLHNFALSSTGGWYVWGKNSSGQLGTGTTSNLSIPTLGSAFIPGPEATLGSVTASPTSLTSTISCGGNCGSSDSYSYAVSLSATGEQTRQITGVASSLETSFSFTGLSPNKAYTLQVSVTYNGDTSEIASSVASTPKPIATISAVSVLDTSATLTVGCTNCGSAPDSFTVSATPVAGGQAITSNTNLITGLSSETTYSFSVVVAFAGTTSDVVLWQSNPVMTLPFVPIISAVSPPAVPLTGGSITVVGSNFTTSTELTLDGATLSFTIVSGTEITFSAPSGTAGSFDLAITNPVGTYTLSNAITYVAPPTLVTNSPVLGTTNGGTIVTLTGTDLITTNQVNVGSTTVSFSVISNSVVRFVTAATSAGVVDIGVVTIGGAATLSSALEFTSSPLIPVVSSITPTSGPNSGGTLITVTGQYFSGSYSDSVSAAINGVSGSSVILIDDSTLTFVSPAGTAGVGLDVSVATGGGLGTLAGAFTYTAPPAPVAIGSAPAVVINTPTITEFSTRKISASGAQVTATGLRLENISVLTLGGITVTIVSNTATTLTFTTGEMPVGIWDLRLVASNGTLVFQQAIEVIEIQEISTESTGELISFAVTLRFSGNSRVLNDQQESHLHRRLRSDADTIICWGYTTSQDPKSWALAHANARAQAACNLALEGMPGVSSIVRLRYGMPKDLAMRASVQFWKVVE